MKRPARVTKQACGLLPLAPDCRLKISASLDQFPTRIKRSVGVSPELLRHTLPTGFDVRNGAPTVIY
jgi:hypothetical protein